MSGFANPITDNTGKLVINNVHSANYVPGVSGWTIRKDGFAEFGSGVFRGDVVVGVSPNPRINITTNIPASLVTAFGSSLTITAAYIDYFNATDFYFDVLGINGFGDPVMFRGSLIGGVLIRYEELNSATQLIQFYGSAGNPAGSAWVYQGDGTITYQKDINIEKQPFSTTLNLSTGEIVPVIPMAVGSLGSGAMTQLASNTTTELVFASAAYDTELIADFQDNHVFKVTVTCAVTNNGFASNSGEMRIRQGRATTTGTILAQWIVEATTNSANSRYYEGFFINFTGADKLNQYLSLCWHRNTGVGIVSLQGNVDTPLEICVYDLGQWSSLSQQIPFHRNMT